MTTPDPRSDAPGARVSSSAPGTPAQPVPPPQAPKAPEAGPRTEQSAPRREEPPRKPKKQAGGTGRGIGLALAAALLIFVTVVLVLFIMFNTQTVQISLVFGDVQAPLVLALLIAAGLGALLVALVGAVLRARRSRG